MKRKCSESLPLKWDIIYLPYFPLHPGKTLFFLMCLLCFHLVFFLFSVCKIIILDFGAQPGLHCMKSLCTVHTDLTRLSGDVIYWTCLVCLRPSIHRSYCISYFRWCLKHSWCDSCKDHTSSNCIPDFKNLHQFDHWGSKFMPQTPLRYYCQIWTNLDDWFLALVPSF